MVGACNIFPLELGVIQTTQRDNYTAGTELCMECKNKELRFTEGRDLTVEGDPQHYLPPPVIIP